eukprot:TRINITY_DN6829_c0_g1_i1.p1 TRINITY_DN6829_c0_g1~~TRINITY_DN6829_c0_g1_i1.p1  ORF type:complete len:504 (+),score=158.66 TRINITY_DN6829_c0_g1_i1:82-1593(+)
MPKKRGRATSLGQQVKAEETKKAKSKASKKKDAAPPITSSMKEEIENVEDRPQIEDQIVEEEFIGTMDGTQFFQSETPSSFKEMTKTKVADSSLHASLVFEWMISPVPSEKFIDAYWDRKPLIIKRNFPEYYQGLGDLQRVKKTSKIRPIPIPKTLEAIKMQHGKRVMGSLPISTKTATPEAMDTLLKNNYHLHLHHPQQYIKSIWRLVAYLEDFLGFPMNATYEMSSPQSADPHPLISASNTDRFILQSEGSSAIRMFSPPIQLPYTESKNYPASELGDAILDSTISAGDLLYVPRGFPVSMTSSGEGHNTRILIHTIPENNNWFHFFSLAIPRALELAVEEDPSYRELLPVNFHSYMGVMFDRSDPNFTENSEDSHGNPEKAEVSEDSQESSQTDPRRGEFENVATQRFFNLKKFLPFDGVSDQLAIPFLERRIVLPSDIDRDSILKESKLINIDTMVRLVAKNAVRIVIEGEFCCLYTYVNNDRNLHGISTQEWYFNFST